MWYQQLSLSCKLTLFRLICSPLILPFFLVYLLPYNNFVINNALAGLFLCFGATDFFDGYFARKYHQVTKIGATLDHIADKFLLYSVLIALVAVDKLYFFWAIIWIGREFLVMGLRQFSLENNFSVVVSSWGKLKTVLQIMSLTIIIVNPYQLLGLDECWWNKIELIFLIIATLFSLFSLYDYYTVFMKRFISEDYSS